MHIPDLMLQGAICPITSTISVIAVSGAAYFATKCQTKPENGYFAAITALIFALQMLNFPISSGTSGHLLGGIMAASLLGVPFAILSMSIIITIQAVLFSDGGLTTLGVNIFNMAILGAGCGGFLYEKLTANYINQNWAMIFTAWLTVIIASLAVSIELALDGQIPFVTVAIAMLHKHSLIGIGEAIITIGCYQLFYVTATNNKKFNFIHPLIMAVIIGAIISPHASNLPDGLEWVAARYQIFHEQAPAFVGYLSGYIVPSLKNQFFATAIASLIGVIITFVLSWSLTKLTLKPHLNFSSH